MRFLLACLLIFAAAPARADNGIFAFGTLVVRTPGLLAGRHKTVMKHVKKEHLGAAWPLTTDDAYLACAPSARIPAMTLMIIVNGRPYALNGATRGQAVGDVYSLVLPDTTSSIVLIDDQPFWWARDTTTPRKYIGVLFDIARDMGCLEIQPKS